MSKERLERVNVDAVTVAGNKAVMGAKPLRTHWIALPTAPKSAHKLAVR